MFLQTMLAVESLTEVLSFLPLYDLEPVLFTNRQLSSIAYKCVKGIRVWHFKEVHIFLYQNAMSLAAPRDTVFAVEGRENVANVLDIALYNSYFEYLVL